MYLFDIRTMLIAGAFSEIITASVLVIFWKSARSRFDGIGLIALSFCINIAAWLLPAFRGENIPDFFTMVIPNTLAVGGAYLTFLGLERFTGCRTRQAFNIMALTAFPFIHSYFLYIEPSLNMRTLILFTGMGIFFSQNAFLLLVRVGAHDLYYTIMTGRVYIALTILCCLHIIQLLLNPSPASDFLKVGDADALFLIALLMLSLLLTFSIIMMVNRRLLAAIHEQEEKYAKAFYYAPYAIIIKRRLDEVILEVNAGFSKMTGFSNEEVVGKSVRDIKIWDKERDHMLVMEEILKTGKVEEREIIFRKKSGEELVGLYSAEPIIVNGEEYILSSINDITERKHIEEKIQRLANHDALTDLPSLRLANDRLFMAMCSAKRDGSKVAVFFLDLDGFKSINDNYGHKSGDDVLQQIASRLATAMRSTDTVARIGGDEFLIIAAELKDAADAAIIASNIINTFSDPIDIERGTVEVTASIGISIFPDDSEDPDTLIKLADDTMYRIKKSGKNSFQFAQQEEMTPSRNSSPSF